MLARHALAVSLAFLVVGACTDKKKGASADAAPSASASAVANADVEASTPARIYSLDAGAADPRATKLCHALQDVPASRRAECCGDGKGFVFVAQCEGLLSAALHGNAVTLSDADVDACVQAVDREVLGCDWVAPSAPPPPTECLGIVHGVSPKGSRCRSSLECADGGRCIGVGPNRVGTCGAPPPDGEPCGGTVDSLATYVRDVSVDSDHPECSGYCKRSKCAPATALGEACTFNQQCGAHAFCAAGKCADSPSKIGESCNGAVCDRAATCIDKKCAPQRETGGACTSDDECVGGCIVLDGATKGVCGKKCR